MQVRIVAFTRKGVETAKHVASFLSVNHGYEVIAYTLEKYCIDNCILPIKNGLKKWTEEAFKESDAIIFVSATGIAVRAIASFIKDKYTDPAVIVLDEKGKYVISLLSGHVGGANRLAKKIAISTEGTAIISTATDVNDLFAVDEWAYQKGFKIRDRHEAKLFAAKILEGEQIKLKTPFPIEGNLPKQITLDGEGSYTLEVTTSSSTKEIGLQVVPPIIVLGIGCRRGITMEAIEWLIHDTLEQADLCIEAVGAIATIDLKKDEEGLIEVAKKYRWPIHFHTSELLQQIEGEFSPSEFVKRITKVDNVCERAAVATSGGRLITKKRSHQGMTIAIAQAPLVLDWNY